MNATDCIKLIPTGQSNIYYYYYCFFVFNGFRILFYAKINTKKGEEKAFSYNIFSVVRKIFLTKHTKHFTHFGAAQM